MGMDRHRTRERLGFCALLMASGSHRISHPRSLPGLCGRLCLRHLEAGTRGVRLRAASTHHYRQYHLTVGHYTSHMLKLWGDDGQPAACAQAPFLRLFARAWGRPLTPRNIFLLTRARRQSRSLFANFLGRIELSYPNVPQSSWGFQPPQARHRDFDNSYGEYRPPGRAQCAKPASPPYQGWKPPPPSLYTNVARVGACNLRPAPP